MTDSWNNENNSDKKSWESPGGLNPMTVMQTASSYWQSCVLHSANRLDIFNKLDGTPKTAAILADETQSEKRAIDTLMTALVAMGFLDRDGEIYKLNKISQVFLTTSSDFYQGGIVYMFENWYEAWGGLFNTVKTGKPSALMHKEYSEKETRDYMMGMHNRALSQSGVLTSMVDLTGKKQLMDVGCGPGTFSILFCKRYEGLNAVIMDRPDNINIAKEIISEYKMENRVKPIVGDYMSDDLGNGNDAMLLSSMTNQESPENLKKLLTRCYDSMNSGGVMMIQEQLLNPDKKGPLLAALIGLNQVINTEGGKSYSTTEMKNILSEIGYIDLKSRQMDPPSPFVLITGVKP